MKFSLAAFAAIVPIAAAGNLRSVKVEEPSDSIKMEGRLQLAGLAHPPTEEELAVVDGVVVEAYNHVYYKADSKMEASKSTEAILLGDVEEEDADHFTLIVSDFTTLGQGGYCRWCVDYWDDWDCYVDPNCSKRPWLSEAQLADEQAKDFHAHFESRVCKMLRKSGVENFSKVKDCSFYMLENPGFDIRLSEENTYEALNGIATNAEISLVGLKEQPSEDALAVLKTAILDAHESAFYQTNYKLASVDTTSFVPINGDIVIVASAVPALKDTVAEVNEIADIAAIHQAFEEAFCGKIQKSGVAIFANVHECSFRFVFNPRKEAKTKQAVAVASA